jgi:DNA-binding CsgD family transcriptional regulator
VIQTLAPHRSEKALADRIQVGRARRDIHKLDAGPLGHRGEALPKLVVVVPEEKSRSVTSRRGFPKLLGGFIRLFVDLGPAIARLLNRLDLDEEGQHYVEQILIAFVDGEKTEDKDAVGLPLTKREVDVVKLLSNDLTNKQISERLHISSAAVKRHTENIYLKSAVSDRHKAVAKARGIGILRAF